MCIATTGCARRNPAQVVGGGLFNVCRILVCVALAIACLAGGHRDTLGAESVYQVIRGVTYATRDDGELKADVYRPAGAGPFPAVICIHGGAWFSGGRYQMVFAGRRLAEHGYVAIAINYRLAPKHKFPAQIEDCRAAVQWATKSAGQYKIDPERIAAWGYSAGGHLAALLGVSEPRIKAVVAGGAPCDFRQLPADSRALAYWLGGTRSELPDVYRSASPAALVDPKSPPFFFYHGEADVLVPLEQPKDMIAVLKKAGVEAQLHIVPKTGHIAAFLDRQAVEEAIKFLDKHLRKAAAKQ
jgi:acetyl esterase/lipase